MSDPNQSRADTLKHAQIAMQQGRFRDAANLTDGLLAVDPNDQDALYMAAVAARYDTQFEAAQTHIERLKTLAPDFGRAFQEEGHLKRAIGDIPGALTAYRFATRYNPALLASFEAEAALLREIGQNPSQAEAQAARLKALPRPLLAVTNHIPEGKIFQAEEIARAFMRQNPRNVEGMRLLAEIGTRLGVNDDADFIDVL